LTQVDACPFGKGQRSVQSFDGLKASTRIRSWRVDEFLVKPDADRPGFFDNRPDPNSAFWGVYATRNFSPRTGIDVYYLGLRRLQSLYNRGTGKEDRQTFGARLWRTSQRAARSWDGDYEAASQAGRFGQSGIRAWTIASETGYSCPDLALQPRASIKADISSGDDPRRSRLGTFNALFPIGNYFGVLSDTGSGPINFIDVHPKLQTKVGTNLSVSGDVVVQWRESVTDGVYAVPGTLLVPAGTSTARFVGYRPGIEVRWQIDLHAYAQADYGVFHAGRFLREAAPGRNIDYATFWFGYKF